MRVARVLVIFALLLVARPAAALAEDVPLSLTAPWTHDAFAYPGQWLPARGNMSPEPSASATSTVIVCERLEDGVWVERERFPAAVIVDADGTRYEAKTRFGSAGSWRVRAQHADDTHAPTLGPATAVEVTDWRARYIGKLVRGFKTPNKRKLVAITIDDGPNKRTMAICSILEQYGAKGTFFFTRKLLARGYGRQAKKAYDRGHEIANHTISHKMLTRSFGYSRWQATGARDYITRAVGFTPTWIRAMGGGINKRGMRAVVSTGQLYANWSLDSADSRRRYTKPHILYHNVVDHVRPGDVILIHQTHPETVKALPAILAELKRRGYTMVTLSELAYASKRR